MGGKGVSALPLNPAKSRQRTLRRFRTGHLARCTSKMGRVNVMPVSDTLEPGRAALVPASAKSLAEPRNSRAWIRPRGESGIFPNANVGADEVAPSSGHEGPYK
jgi:hypothetical protein